MADALNWPTEEIPDTDSLFMRAHRVHFRDGELQTGVFRPQGDGMSGNWNRYATAEETKQQAKNNPDDNAVVSLPVGGIRQIPDLRVEHTPEPSNRAHSEVFGFPEQHSKLTEIRVLLRRIAGVAIPLA